MNAKYTPKEEQIQETGRKLFMKFGIKRVTVEEICREAGVSKMTFYKYFSNKTGLVKRVIDTIYRDSMNKYRAIMDSDRPFTEKIADSVVLKMEQTKEMSSEFIRDYLNDAEPEMVTFLNRMFTESLTAIADDFSKAQQEGNIRKDMKIEFILYFMNHMIEMVEDEKLLAMYETPQELIYELINFFFYGIMDPNRERS